MKKCGTSTYGIEVQGKRIEGGIGGRARDEERFEASLGELHGEFSANAIGGASYDMNVETLLNRKANTAHQPHED